ncbi:MAG: GntR family transcriptional regulator [Planctomycetaceae bacterium]|nr:GntR family transcriptional regulator [Planctomycetaceae bacterium]
MFIRIEKGSSTPISRQIAEQIRAQCLSGRIKPGTQIPSVRQLARDLAVNQNTVLRVYEKLMAEKLLDMRHGEGTFVVDRLPRNELKALQVRFFDELTQVTQQGRLLGFTADDLHSLLDDALTQTQDSSNPTDDVSHKQKTGDPA